MPKRSEPSFEVMDTGLLIKGCDSNLAALQFAHEQGILPTTLTITVKYGYWRKTPAQWADWALREVGKGDSKVGAFQAHLIKFDVESFIVADTGKLAPHKTDEILAALRVAVKNYG